MHVVLQAPDTVSELPLPWLMSPSSQNSSPATILSPQKVSHDERGAKKPARVSRKFDCEVWRSA